MAPILTSLLAFLFALAPARAGTLRVDMLDVGQGDSILIRTPANKTILIDAGDGDTSVPALLQKEGVDHLDLVIATHPHADHIGGMDAVVQSLPIKNYIDNGLPHTTQTYQKLMTDIEGRKIPYKAAIAGQVFNLDDGAKLEVLFPNGTPLTNTRSDLNANSVVTRLTHAGHCFLFTGDSEEPTEQALLASGKLGKCDVLKVAHHGSNHSTTPALLDAVHPSIALVSVGVHNRYGHPGEETLKRIATEGATIYRTDLSGQITVTSDEKGIHVTTQKDAAAVLADSKPPDATTAPTPAAVPQNLTPASAGSVPKAVCPFPSSRTSQVFHEDGCGNAAKIAPENLVCYATRDEAIKAGKRPAGCCKP
jgi:beta-lactamase superfamily II metal-dependent hydrolase